MSFQKIREATNKILTRLDAVVGKGEQATKQALVLPMLEALGFDIWNPMEVCPEFEADFAQKKLGQKEKVDLAVLFNNIPRIYIEVKPYQTTLDGHEGQLARYFNATPSVSLAILTNGSEYRFFTDSKEPNLMDANYFHVVNIQAPDPGLEVMTRFHKDVYSPEAIRDLATELNYSAKMSAIFRRELDLRTTDPTDSFVRWILDSESLYDGRITANVIERFRPIVKKSLQRVIREIVLRSFAAIDEEISPQPSAQASPPDAAQAEQQAAELEAAEHNRAIVTTERELECFAILKRQFETSILASKPIFEPSIRKGVPIEISYKDTTSYFAVYFNKPSWWVARIYVEAKKPWVGFNVEPEAGKPLVPAGFEVLESNTVAAFRVAINSPQDLHALNQVVFAAFEKTIKDQDREQ